MSSISKNVYIYKTDDIVNEYNNTYYGTINMKPIDGKDNTYIDAIKEANDKALYFKFVIMLKQENTKTFMLQDILQIDLKKFL